MLGRWLGPPEEVGRGAVALDAWAGVPSAPITSIVLALTTSIASQEKQRTAMCVCTGGETRPPCPIRPRSSQPARRFQLDTLLPTNDFPHGKNVWIHGI